MYPIPQSPIPTTSGFVPNRLSSTFKPIHPAAPSTASGQATQGSPMVDSTQETGSPPGSSIPRTQKSPATSQPSPTSTQAEAQPNAVPNIPENKVPKSNGGQGVKSSAPDGQMCFRCKQPRHLKKDCPEQPYCSRCCTRGHIPVKCSTKN